MRIALFGSTGQIGQALLNEINKNLDFTAWAPTREEVNLYDTDNIYKYVINAHPDIIINAAAYTDVDGAEVNTELADKINHYAVRELALVALALGIPIVHYSSDYVFDGIANVAYSETATPNPISHYGVSKLAGDEAIMHVGPRGVIFRTSWIYSASQNNFVSTMDRVMQSDAHLNIVGDQTGVPNLADVIAKHSFNYINWSYLGPMELINLVCNGECTWYIFAQWIRKLLGKPDNIVINKISTETYVRKHKSPIAARPKFSVLDNTKAKERGLIILPWDVEFTNFIENRKGLY